MRVAGVRRYQSSKTYTHAEGFSCCFRQWRASHSHCSKLHGYAIEVHVVFEADSLDERNWVVDFGGLQTLKTFLKKTFDHKVIVAADDPILEEFLKAEKIGLMDVVVLPAVGCEMFAQYIATFLIEHMHVPHALLRSVTVREHAGNSASVVYDRV